jgi:hypothetical protein
VPSEAPDFSQIIWKLIVTAAIAQLGSRAGKPELEGSARMLELDIASKKKRKISDYPYRIDYQARW